MDILIKECCDPEDDDGFIPYEREFYKIKISQIRYVGREETVTPLSI